MKITRAARIMGLAICLTIPALAVAAGDARELGATYAIGSAIEGPATTELTFSFTLINRGKGTVELSKIVLSDPAMKDEGYATFEGGKLDSDSSLNRSATVTVPNAIVESWKKGAPPALFVYTESEEESNRRTRIDASPGPQ